MKLSLLAGTACLVLLCAGCQSLNWTAKSKEAKESKVVDNTRVREVPWTWRKKKADKNSDSVPAEIAAKFEKSKGKPDSPKSATEWVLDGNQQETARNFPAARKAYESALAIDPVNADAHHRLGILADMRQDYAAAQDHYDAALRQKPHDANLLSDYGYSNQLRGNAHQSERQLLMALDMDGQHKQALRNLGSLYASQNRYQDAAQAFRRFRSEAEAQQLLTQYFPAGPSGDNGTTPVVAAHTPGENRTPLPSEEIDPAVLKNMSPDEIYQVMEQKRQDAVRAREQKTLAELRPQFQDRMTEADLQRASATNAWAQEPTHPPVVNANRSQPGNLESTGTSPFAQMDTGNVQPPVNPPPADQFAKAPDQPFWNGAPLQNRSAPASQQNATTPPWDGGQNPFASSGAGTNGAFSGSSAAPPPWSSSDPTAAAVNAGSMPGGYQTSQDRAFMPGNSNGNPPNNANAQATNVAPSNMTPQQRAYQLGMSAGPGTMFPSMPADASANAQPGSSWASNTNSSYPETQPTANWGPPAQSNATEQWRDALTEAPPRSPTENWNPPSMVQWPGQPATYDVARAPAGSQPPASRLPVINPGPTGYATTNGAPPSGNVNTGNFDARDWATSDVAPVRFDTPAGTPNSSRTGNTNSVPQWPYAPK